MVGRVLKLNVGLNKNVQIVAKILENDRCASTRQFEKLTGINRSGTRDMFIVE